MNLYRAFTADCSLAHPFMYNTHTHTHTTCNHATYHRTLNTSPLLGFLCSTSIFLFLCCCFLVLLHCHIQSWQPEGFGAAHRGCQRLWRVGGCYHTGQVPFSHEVSPTYATGKSDPRMSVTDDWIYKFEKFSIGEQWWSAPLLHFYSFKIIFKNDWKAMECKDKVCHEWNYPLIVIQNGHIKKHSIF